MPSLLLHICCAPCGTYISHERLAPRFNLTWYFYNPNLDSRAEYDRRLEAVAAMADKFDFPLIVEPYEHAAWCKLTAGREADPERGPRCRICYGERLARTARLAQEKKFDYFGTTLLVSPYKDTVAIRALGRAGAAASGVPFLDEDFQADDGYRRSQQLARALGLYRQKYCGCEYSLGTRVAATTVSPATPPSATTVSRLWRRLTALIFLAVLVFGRPVLARAATIGTATDTDGDGYSDVQEIRSGYSPYNPARIKITASDMDGDGLSDYWELKFHTDPLNPDTDGDGYNDGTEVDRAYDPLASSTASRLSQSIAVNLSDQRLTYLVGGEAWKVFPVSTGEARYPTPTGNFKILSKAPKAWSGPYKLWMPYWMNFKEGEYGLHELPIWPNGYQEGADHLGVPVSHGCIRLGVGPAQYLYDRVGLGTAVIIR